MKELTDEDRLSDEEYRCALRARCDGFFEECRRRAESLERVQEGKRRALDQWTKDRGVDRHGIQRYRPVTPRPRRDGLHTRAARMMRHFDSPAGRLLLTVRAAESLVLPSLAAGYPEERERISALLAEALRLSEAMETGLLRGYVVCWQQTGRWPRRPQSLRLHWPDGKAQGDRLLGEHGRALNEMIRSMQVRIVRIAP